MHQPRELSRQSPEALNGLLVVECLLRSPVQQPPNLMLGPWQHERELPVLVPLLTGLTIVEKGVANVLHRPRRRAPRIFWSAFRRSKNKPPPGVTAAARS